MFYPEELVEEVRTKNDIVDVISGYVKLQRRGSSYLGLCPFHNEKTPSFRCPGVSRFITVSAAERGASAISFVQEIEHTDFMGAIKILADKYRMPVPDFQRTTEIQI